MRYRLGIGMNLHVILMMTLSLSLPLSGCAGSESGFLGFVRPGQKTNKDRNIPTAVSDIANATKASESIESFAQSLANRINAPGAFEKLAATSINEVFEDPMEWASNDTINVFGYSFERMLDKLTTNQMNEARQQTVVAYATIGDYLASLGVYSAADLDFSNFGDTIARYEQYLQNIDDTESPSIDTDADLSEFAADAGLSLKLSPGEFIKGESRKKCSSSAQDSRNFGHMCGACMREHHIPSWNRVKADNHCIMCKAEEGATLGNMKRFCTGDNSALPAPPENPGPMVGNIP